MSYKQAELLGCRFGSVWKAQLLLFPIIILSSLFFSSFIWSLAEIPSAVYPYTEKIWDLTAKNTCLVYSATLGEYSQFSEALGWGRFLAGNANGWHAFVFPESGAPSEASTTSSGTKHALAAGGGRYDGLIEEIGGNPTPAVGFATGLERVLLALEKQNLLPEMDTKTDAFVVALGEEAQGAAFKLLTKLRQAGLKAGMDYAGRSMKAQMKQANKANARFALIIGEDEVKEACVQLKDMEKSEQEKVSFDNIIEKLCAEVKG